MRKGRFGVILVTLFLGMQTIAFACSRYDIEVLSDQPLMFLAMDSVDAGKEQDISKHKNHGVYLPADNPPAETAMPNGDSAAVFDGHTQYLEVSDTDSLSVPASGVLTIEAWIRPDTLQFSNQQGSGYVHWMGKGTTGQQEYALRMYSYTNAENPPRPNRISGYAFNLNGGYGSGSYFQDPVISGQWIHVAVVINTTVRSTTYPTGYVKIFKNGVLRDTTPLNQYNVIPGNGAAPLRIGTRDFGSYFKGAIGKVAIYNYEVAPERLVTHYHIMCAAGC